MGEIEMLALRRKVGRRASTILKRFSWQRASAVDARLVGWMPGAPGMG